MYLSACDRAAARPTALLRALTLCCLLATAAPLPAAEKPVQAVDGLWAYTDLITRDGESLPLTGIFLFKDGTFLQQSIFDGEPFDEQGAMAHVGPYGAGGAGIRMTSEQTLSLQPGKETPITSAGAMEHDLAVTREGDALTIQFGGGTSTIQTFRRLGDADDAEIHPLADGALALADGYFILVSGDAERAVTGYGTYERSGDHLRLAVTRWAESDGEAVRNLRDVALTAFFDGNVLVLPGGRRFAVTR